MKRNVQTPAKGKRRATKPTRRARPLSLTTPSYNRLLGVKPGFQPMMKFVHKYVEVISLTDSGTGANYSWSCNGLYDPNNTGTGHQPLYFDQITPIYAHYCVVSSKIKITMVPAGTAVQYPYRCAVYLNDDNSVTAGIDAAAEQSTGSVKVCSGGVNPTPIVLYKNWNAVSTFHPNPLADSELRGNSSNNPAEQTFYTMSLRAMVSAVTVDTYFQVELEYTTVWTELRDIASS